MGKDEWLFAFSPITLLSAGGFLAVNLFRNRESTEDLDYLIEPKWTHDDDIKGPLRSAMVRTARHLGFAEDWANDEMALFVPDISKQRLFEAAQKQNIVLWEGTNLRVLAVPLKWALERKLRRIHDETHNSKRESDMDDSLALLKYLRAQNGGPLNMEQIRTLNFSSIEMPPDHATMMTVAAAYRKRYNEEAFA